MESYRLIGYEKRLLNNEYLMIIKDASEMGAGHIVITLYEIVPLGVESKKIELPKYAKVSFLLNIAKYIKW